MTSSRPLIIGLAVSAVINVFLIGGLAGMTYVRLTTPPPPAAASPTAAPTAPVAASIPPVVPAPPKNATPIAPSVPASAPQAKPHRVASARVEPPPAKAAPPPVVAPPQPAPPQPAPPTPGRPSLASAGDVLSPESRKAFRKALGDANQKNRALSQQARAERQSALNALGQPGYDAAEVSKRLALARSLDLQARANVEAALAAFAATLPPPERVALADALEEVYAPARVGALPSPN
ncbi:periplasmic heavy metal sensor [Caulobacter vibrioides]|jgi:uncharacterized membrane protein|uniref:Periplasmic heavy metal sensor n=3 Tax=Caulobacter TaxID=75 RepID=R0CYA6_CAUVI|nr:periplasmic heavy metal sensor [Caulobacter vibrioides]ENZ81466.1 hypothetical protein OR37_02577 [Caulobacter vibrioides OR37]